MKSTFQVNKALELTLNDDCNSKRSYASPPCFLHELDLSYMGYLSRMELLSLLNELLEIQRAVAQCAGEMSSKVANTQSDLCDIANEEARFCAMLAGHIASLGGTSSAQTGPLHARASATQSTDEKLELLSRGQAWVIRKLQEALPKIGDSALHRDLQNMLEVHEQNIRLCRKLI